MRHDSGKAWQLPEDEVRYSIAFRRTAPPGAERVTLEEAERNALARLRQGWTLEALNDLLAVYRKAGREEKVRNCLIALVETTPDLELRALFYVYLGQSFERSGDYEDAIEAYREAMALEPCGGFAAYFLHSNLAYCLNLLGRHAEAERLAAIAIQIDPARPYAYTNLGVSLEGQHDLQGAFAAWVYATRVNAADDRSLALMQAMLDAHPELLAVPGVRESLEECRQAVAFARQLMHSARN